MEKEFNLDIVPIIVGNTVELENKYMIQGIDMMRALIVLNERIEKAIEYIYKNSFDEERKMIISELWEGEINDLLAILKGSDKE